MSKFDPAAFGRFVGRETRRMIRDAIAPVARDVDATRSLVDGALQGRIKHLEDRPAPEIDTQALRRSLREELRVEFDDSVKSAIAAALPLAVAKYLEANPPPAGKDGRDGVDGKDGVDGMPGDRGPAGGSGPDGAPGAPGPQGLTGERGSDGADGKDGQPGADGKDGRDGIDGQKGLDGKDGLAGTNGVDGKEGRPGVDGAKGADGLGLAGAMIDRDGALQITLTNGEVKSLGKVVGKDGDHGSDGASFESFELEYLPESHEIAVKATVAGRTKELRYPAGGIRPAGYWREGTKAAAGEAWVHDGSLWIAKSPTAAKPESRSDDWIIAARKGRDGERGGKGADGSPPAPIKLQS